MQKLLYSSFLAGFSLYPLKHTENKTGNQRQKKTLTTQGQGFIRSFLRFIRDEWPQQDKHQHKHRSQYTNQDQ